MSNVSVWPRCHHYEKNESCVIKDECYSRGQNIQLPKKVLISSPILLLDILKQNHVIVVYVRINIWRKKYRKTPASTPLIEGRTYLYMVNISREEVKDVLTAVATSAIVDGGNLFWCSWVGSKCCRVTAATVLCSPNRKSRKTLMIALCWYGFEPNTPLLP